MATGPDEDTVASLLGAYDARRQITPLSQSLPGLEAATAYGIAHQITALREDRGERRMGRKIGFTNRTIWPLYGVSGPMWGHVWDTTLHDLTDQPVAKPDLPEPRLEPEMIFGLKSAPRAGMSVDELTGCIDWLSHGFEIVFSPFPGWQFAGTDCAAAFGLHGALYVGPRLAMTPERASALPDLHVTLSGSNGQSLHGHGYDVLDGPVQALGYLLETLATDPGAAPIGADEIITTGTLTDAVPIAPGDTWQTTLTGIDLPGAQITFA